MRRNILNQQTSRRKSGSPRKLQQVPEILNIHMDTHLTFKDWFPGLPLHDQVASNNAKLKYVLTYKLSQDHIKLFFAAIHSSYGCNNNPTALQFRSAYKRMLVRHEIASSSGNCRVRVSYACQTATYAISCFKKMQSLPGVMT